MMRERVRGTVLTYNHGRGYGRVALEGGGKSFSVYNRSIHGEGYRYLFRGEAVECQIWSGSDGSIMSNDITGPEESKLRWEVGERQKGTVKCYDYERGYGLITPEGGGEDLKVDYTGIRFKGIWTMGMQKGEAVEYHILPSTNVAFNVTKPGQSQVKGTYSGLSYGGKRVWRGGSDRVGSAKKIRIH